MASSIHSVQNFSLPSRAGSRRTVTPLAGSVVRDVCNVREVDRVVQLVQACDRPAAAGGGARCPRPRPMSTSSSAPALATSESAAACPPRHHHRLLLLPSSPAGSVWPLPGVPRPSAAAREGEEAGEKATRETPKQLSSHERRPSCAQSHTSGFDDGIPPPLARSISVRWGPRLRHISLSEVQAADDAVRHLAALRRHRLLFWLLAVGLLAGMLSCTAALTLVVVARAVAGMQMGQTGQAPAVKWESHGIAWLVGSLVAGAVAGAVLAVVVWRWRQRQTGWHRRSGGEGEGGGVIGGAGEEEGVEAERADDSRDWIEMADLADLSGLSGASHRRKKGDEDGDIASSHCVQTAWWKKKKGRPGTTEADVADRRSAGPAEDAHVEGQSPPAALGAGDDIAACEKKEGAEESEEDRNWARFAQDPMQLRRYVEALEARLAAAQGMPDKTGELDKGMGKDEADKTGKVAHEVEDADIADEIDEIAGPAENTNSAGMSSSSNSSSPVVGGLAIGGPDASSSSLLLPLPQPHHG